VMACPSSETVAELLDLSNDDLVSG
jgi:hypothetical protein